MQALLTLLIHSVKARAALVVASVLLFVWWRVWLTTPSWAAGDQYANWHP
ncbi:MAG: hypothetical protein JOY92_08725 [Verrucomicrobia bacterium]|nr:hypothetical protein [Verrucomicrobiota bacterium]